MNLIQLNTFLAVFQTPRGSVFFVHQRACPAQSPRSWFWQIGPLQLSPHDSSHSHTVVRLRQNSKVFEARTKELSLPNDLQMCGALEHSACGFSQGEETTQRRTQKPEPRNAATSCERDPRTGACAWYLLGTHQDGCWGEGWAGLQGSPCRRKMPGRVWG